MGDVVTEQGAFIFSLREKDAVLGNRTACVRMGNTKWSKPFRYCNTML